MKDRRHLTAIYRLLALMTAVNQPQSRLCPPTPCIAGMTLFLIGVCMSVCLHRYFSHTAFVPTSRAFTFCLAVLSTLAYQYGQSGGACERFHETACIPVGIGEIPTVMTDELWGNQTTKTRLYWLAAHNCMYCASPLALVGGGQAPPVPCLPHFHTCTDLIRSPLVGGQAPPASPLQRC